MKALSKFLKQGSPMNMSKFFWNTLVRDKESIEREARGSIVHTRKITEYEFYVELFKKLHEKAIDARYARYNDEIAAEFAEMYEIIDTLCALYGIKHQDILTKQAQTRVESGGFMGRTFVHYVRASRRKF